MAKNRTKADWLNILTFRTLYNHYMNMALNVFKWSGLPEGIEERYIEKTLFDHGMVLFFRDPQQSYMALKCGYGHKLDVYGEPLFYRAEGLNYNKIYRRTESVLIENNKLRVPTSDTLYYFVRKLYEAERAMDVNLQTSKVPWIILCDEKQLLTYKEVFRKIDENEPAIFGTKGISLDALQVLPTKGEFICNELMDFSHGVENKLLTFLGVDNLPVDKKERLVTGEVESNDQQVQTNADLMLEARQRACEKINKMFGLNVSVELRHKPKEVEQDVAPDAKQQSDH